MATCGDNIRTLLKLRHYLFDYSKIPMLATCSYYLLIDLSQVVALWCAVVRAVQGLRHVALFVTCFRYTTSVFGLTEFFLQTGASYSFRHHVYY